MAPASPAALFFFSLASAPAPPPPPPAEAASTVTKLDTRPHDSPLSALIISLSTAFSLLRLLALRVATRSPRSASIFFSAALPAALRLALPSRSLASFSSPAARKRF